MPLDISASLAEASRTLYHSKTLEDTLDEIVRVAQRSIPGFDEVGISTIDRHGTISTRAATGDLVWALDDLQYRLREGPCVDAILLTDVVPVPDIRHQQWWPRFVPEAVALGLRSQLAFKLFLDDEGTLGGLNLYSTSRDDLHPEAENIAELFAAHAAVALGHARRHEQLSVALGSRKTIGQALGIVMERYGLDEERAFQFLVRASSASNTKLRDVAAELVARGNHLPPHERPRQDSNLRPTD